MRSVITVPGVNLHVGKQLKKRRVELGLTQQQVGNRIGATYQHIHKFESGASRMNVSQLFQLSIALDVPIAYFYDGYGITTSAPLEPHIRMASEMKRLTSLIEELDDSARRHLFRFLHALKHQKDPA